MLFNMEHDTGDRLAGYLVPDSFRDHAVISVRVSGREVLRVPTFERRDSLRQAGRHETGLCGYTLDDRHVQDLAGVADLAVHDAATGLMVARRVDEAEVIGLRLIRLETHLLPLVALDRALAPAFRYGYAGLDRYSGETVSQVLLINDGGSLYASGRMTYRSVQGSLEPHAAGVIVLRDPVLELAERLLVLNRIGVAQVPLFGERDRLIWAPAVSFAAGLDFRDLYALRRALASVPARAAALLANPVTRILAAGAPEEAVRSRHVPAALRALSRFTLVGLRERWDEFREDVAALTGRGAEDIPVIETVGAVEQLAAEIRGLRAVNALLAVDLELYAHVRDAFEADRAPPMAMGEHAA
ncbi:MAG: hypothetical protein U1E62_18815 [Alsobacter sp.]